jgi:integrase
MTREQLDELTRRYLRATFDEIEERLALEWRAADRDAHAFALEERGHATAGALAEGDFASVVDKARALAPEASPEDLRKLSRRLLEVDQEAVRAELRALGGEPLALRGMAEPAPVASVTQASAKASLAVSTVAEQYAEERVAGGFWTAKTEHQNRTIFLLLADLLGDPPIGTVSKEMIRRLGQDIVSLPSNMTKRFPGLAPREVLKRLEGDTTTPRLEPRSVNKYRQLARTLFKWAADFDYITKNPAEILRDVKEGRARDARKPFTDEDISRYFAALPQTPEAQPFMYWVPRILAFTGMRLNEAANLRKEDIRREAGVWIFDVNEEGEGRRLKNEHSKRHVPIHSRLVALGLLECVEASPEGFLWPADMRTTDNPIRGDMDKPSKLLGRILRAAGIKDPKKTGAHSFRHTVSSRLKNASVPAYQIADLIGHEDPTMTTGSYGDETMEACLARVVELIRLPI